MFHWLHHYRICNIANQNVITHARAYCSMCFNIQFHSTDLYDSNPKGVHCYLSCLKIRRLLIERWAAHSNLKLPQMIISYNSIQIITGLPVDCFAIWSNKIRVSGLQVSVLLFSTLHSHTDVNTFMIHLQHYEHNLVTQRVTTAMHECFARWMRKQVFKQNFNLEHQKSASVRIFGATEGDDWHTSTYSMEKPMIPKRSTTVASPASQRGRFQPQLSRLVAASEHIAMSLI